MIQRQRGFLGVASAALLIVVVLLVWALAWVHPMVGNLRGIGDDRPKLELLRTARFDDLQAHVALGNALLARDPQRSGVEMERFSQHARLAASALGSLQRLGIAGDGQELLD